MVEVGDVVAAEVGMGQGCSAIIGRHYLPRYSVVVGALGPSWRMLAEFVEECAVAKDELPRGWQENEILYHEREWFEFNLVCL